MKCRYNKQYAQLKVQSKNTKEEQNKHGHLQKLEVGSGVMEE